MEDVAAPYPMKRIGEPKEIAALAVFLASDRWILQLDNEII